MAHLHRFYVPEGFAAGGLCELPAGEAHHARRVVRVQAGDAVALFNGAGLEGKGRVAHIDKHAVRIEVHTAVQRETPPCRLTLAQACLNREDPMEELIRHGTALGVTRFAFFRGDHTARPPKRPDKWEPWAVDACKQSGQPWLPAFIYYESLEGALGHVDPPLYVAQPGGSGAPSATDAATLIVGPEGGLSEAELDLARTMGANAMTLGPYTLRSELAVIVGATLVLQAMGAFDSS
ncbi:MAG: RsmE family RNA methyltransferase [Candidatus Hydrogenedentota bacterium]